MLSRGRAPTRTRPPGVLVCLHLGLSASTGTPNADPDHKYLPPARPTHTPPPHQARRPSHSSPALLSGTPLRVCAGVRERGRACSRPCNALAMERNGDPTYWPHRRPRTPRQAADTPPPRQGAQAGPASTRPSLHMHSTTPPHAPANNRRRVCTCTTRTPPPNTPPPHPTAHHHNPRPRPKPLAADASESPDGSAVASAAARASWACVSAGAAPPVRVSSWRAARLGVPDSLPSFCALYVEPG